MYAGYEVINTMPYVLLNTDGSTLTTVNDASLNQTTSLTFVGRNYAGYGSFIDQNFVYLLQNFANLTAPKKPVQGQIWFDQTTNRLKVSTNGTSFRDIVNVPYTSTSPASPSIGDLWWNTASNQLSVWSGTAWVVPSASGSASASSWAYNKIVDNTGASRDAITGYCGTIVPLVISSYSFTPANTEPVSTSFVSIKKGISLNGADPTTGVSASNSRSGYLLWGTAADAISARGLNTVVSTANSNFYVPLVANSNGISTTIETSASFYYNPSSGVLNAQATSAQYADLAERYEADAVYEVGTVLVIGGLKEVTTTTKFADTRVAGIVSKKPAYLMNSDAGNDETHPAIALKGRVPCKVHGYIERGDLLVTSDYSGYATAAKSVSEGSVIGKALQSNLQGFGVIEVLVV